MLNKLVLEIYVFVFSINEKKKIEKVLGKWEGLEY